MLVGSMGGCVFHGWLELHGKTKPFEFTGLLIRDIIWKHVWVVHAAILILPGWP